MKIALGADHRGYPLKERIKRLLAGKGYEIKDLGCNGSESVDYPDYAFPVAELVASGAVDRGIKGVRAALCRSVDDAVMTRRHNDSNVLTLSEKSMEYPEIDELVLKWLETPFDGGRHKRRVDKISEYERNH